MRPVKILDISDMQNGFMHEDGNLYIPEAQKIIAPTNNFLRQVGNTVFDFTLIILDTHFLEEYSQTEEGKQFPIHCEYGTDDWKLSVDVSGLPEKRYLMKNQFDMWGESRGLDIQFNDRNRKIAHDNLFHFIDNPHTVTKKETRDDFISSITPDTTSANIEVTIIGVASDYCNRYAMEGWLARGARVTIIQDLTKGIEKETPQILNEDRYQQYGTTRLRSVDSAEYLKELINR